MLLLIVLCIPWFVICILVIVGLYNRWRNAKTFDFTGGKTVLITGCSSGIGAELAIQLSKYEGIQLVLVARRESHLKEVAKQFKSSAKYLVISADCAITSECKRVVSTAVEHFGKIDLALFNHGKASVKPFTQMVEDDLEQFDELMRINYLSIVDLTFFIVPQLNKNATIAVTSSMAGLVGPPLRSGYSPTKHALNGFMECLRQDLKHTGVNVTVLCPGYVKTALHSKAHGDAIRKDPDQFETAEGCARKMIGAIQNGDKLWLGTMKYRLMFLLMGWLKWSQIDEPIVRKAALRGIQSSFK